MADAKITELPALTTVLGEDLLAIVDDPTGTAATKKIRTDDFQSGWHVGARVYNDANISLDNGTLTALTFNSERYDTDTIHATGSNTGRLTATTAGKYHISAGVSFAVHATGYRQVAFRVDGSIYIASSQRVTSSASVTTDMVVGVDWEFAAGSYVECIAYQNSGGALNVASGASYTPEFMMHRIG